MPYGKACTLSLLAKAEAGKEGIRRVSFLPMAMDEKYRPEVLLREDPRFDEVLAYLEWASEDMPHRFTIEGNEIIVSE
jgi:poly-gamma-glutamate synthesis protein (capsule biosynthesis protein)